MKKQLFSECFVFAVIFAFGPAVVTGLLAIFLASIFDLSEKQALLFYLPGLSILHHWYLAATAGIFYSLRRRAKPNYLESQLMIGLLIVLACLLLRDIILVTTESPLVLQIKKAIWVIPGGIFIIYHGIRHFATDPKFRPIH